MIELSYFMLCIPVGKTYSFVPRSRSSAKGSHMAQWYSVWLVLIQWSWVQTVLDPQGFLVGVSLGKTLQSPSLVLPCIQLKKTRLPQTVCHKHLNWTHRLPRTFFSMVAIDVFTWLPRVGNDKRCCLYLRVVIVHFFLNHIKTWKMNYSTG